MALSGNSSGGANTNLTGLSPEQIVAMTNSNVAGGNLAQNSIQNIFENVSKMAYSDYLDRLPQDKLPKDPNAKLVEGGDGFYWEHNPVTGAIRKTDIPVSQKKLQYGTGAGSPPYAPVVIINPTTGQPEVQGFNKRTGDVKPPPEGTTPPVSAEASRKAAVDQTKTDRRVTELADLIEGKVVDKATKKPKAATAAEVEEFNQKAETPFAYVVEKKTKKGIFSNSEVEEFIKRPLPNGVTAKSAYKGYKNFLDKGGKGSFDAYIYALEQEMGK